MEARGGNMSDSKDGWKYVIVFSKFFIHLMENSISKSFGVLIPGMAVLFETRLLVLGLLCSFPMAWLLVSCPVVAYVLKYDAVNRRGIAVIGAVISSGALIASAYTRNVIVLGIALALHGLGSGMNYMPTLVLLNEFFPKRFVLMSTVTLFGSIIGILFMPLMTERCVRAYGYSGAMLILGGLMMNSVAGGIAIRKPRDAVVNRGKMSVRDKNASARRRFENGPGKNIKKDSNCNESEREEPCKHGEVHNGNSCTLSEPVGKVGKVLQWLKNLSRWIFSSFFLQDYLFTLTLPSHLLIQYGAYAWMLFLVPRAEWLGVASDKAVLLSTIGGIGALVGRIILFIPIYYEINEFYICLVASGIAALTFLVDSLVTSFPAMCAVAFIQGWVIYTNTAIPPAFCKSTTSPSNFGLGCGYSALVLGLGGIIGGLLSGVIFDITQSYTVVFLSVGGVHCLIILNIIIYLIVVGRKDLVDQENNHKYSSSLQE